MFLSDETAEVYYSTNFTMMNYYNWSLSDIENMFPYERAIYIGLIANHQKKVSQAQHQQQ